MARRLRRPPARRRMPDVRRRCRRDAARRAGVRRPWADGYLGRHPVRPGYAFVIWRAATSPSPPSCRPRRRPGSGPTSPGSPRRWRSSTEPAKMNWLSLGNGVPHLHVHLVPRPHEDARAGLPLETEAFWVDITPAIEPEQLARRGCGAARPAAGLTHAGAAGRGPHRRGLRLRRGHGAQARPPRLERPRRVRGRPALGPGRRGAAGGPPARHRHRGGPQRRDPRPRRRAFPRRRCWPDVDADEAEELADRFATLQLECNARHRGGPARPGAPPPGRDRGRP